MAKRAYRTASGKMVDMDTLALKNETVLAVGNMNVNARGDKVGNGGQIIQTRSMSPRLRALARGQCRKA